MDRRSCVKGIAAVLSVVMTIGSIPQAFARDSRRGREIGHYDSRHYRPGERVKTYKPYGYINFMFRGLEYLFWEGVFLRRSADKYVVVQAPLGAVIATLPSGAVPVVAGPNVYYNANGVTYMYTPAGYQVVSSISASPQNAQNISEAYTDEEGDFIIIHVPNKTINGYTAVKLKRISNGFVGPQGEYYKEFPKVAVLQTVYGK